MMSKRQSRRNFFRLRLTTAGLLYSMSWETLLQTAISARALTRIILIPMRSPRWCQATASLSFSRNTPCMTPSLPPNALNTSRAPESSTRAWLGSDKKHYNMQNECVLNAPPHNTAPVHSTVRGTCRPFVQAASHGFLLHHTPLMKTRISSQKRQEERRWLM